MWPLFALQISMALLTIASAEVPVSCWEIGAEILGPVCLDWHAQSSGLYWWGMKLMWSLGRDERLKFTRVNLAGLPFDLLCREGARRKPELAWAGSWIARECSSEDHDVKSVIIFFWTLFYIIENHWKNKTNKPSQSAHHKVPVGSNFPVLSLNCLNFNLLLKEQKPIFKGGNQVACGLCHFLSTFSLPVFLSVCALQSGVRDSWGLVPSCFEVNTFLRLNLAPGCSQPTFFFLKQRLDLRGPLPLACFSLSSGACCPPSFLSVFLLYQILEEKQLDSLSSVTLFFPISVLQINFKMLLTS